MASAADMDRNIPIVSTGSAGLKPGSLPSEIPNQYQVLRFSRRGLRRYARYFAPDQKRWIGDTRFSDSGDEWYVNHDAEFQQAEATFSEISSMRSPDIHLSKPCSDSLDHIRDVDIVVEVDHKWGGEELALEFRFRTPSGVVPLAGITTCQHTVKAPAFLKQDLFKELVNLHRGFDAGRRIITATDVSDTLEEIGYSLYDMLLPEDAKDIYLRIRDTARNMLIISSDHWIPWELLKSFGDSSDKFLCLQFNMTRWLPGDPQALAVK